MKFGITSEFGCSYLDGRQERLLVCVEPSNKLKQAYSQLSTVGFRRSGQQIYRPHCESCNQCHSIRLPVSLFKPSKSQKRIRSKNKDLSVKLSTRCQPDYYPLFERYINTLHKDGSMYPTSPEQFHAFIESEWTQPLYLEAWLDEQLIAVAVTDKLDSAYSALYTFYAPELQTRSLGTFMVLEQIKLCEAHLKDYLYLGYQIDDCKKMNYKTKFKPYERFFAEEWHLHSN